MKEPKQNTLQERVGAAIKQIRKSKKMTQKELSSASGIEESALCNIEKGRRAGRPQTLEKIANALNSSVPMLYLLAAEKDDFKPPVSEKVMSIKKSVEVLNLY